MKQILSIFLGILFSIVVFTSCTDSDFDNFPISHEKTNITDQNNNSLQTVNSWGISYTETFINGEKFTEYGYDGGKHIVEFNCDGTGVDHEVWDKDKNYINEFEEFTWKYIRRWGKKKGIKIKYDSGIKKQLIFLSTERSLYKFELIDLSSDNENEKYIYLHNNPHYILYKKDSAEEPFSDYKFSFDGIDFADGAYVTQEEVLESVTAIDVDCLDFKIYGNMSKEPEYRIFDLTDKELDIHDFYYPSQNELKLPSKAGLYLIKISVVWGDENTYSGLDYYIKIKID